MTAVAQETEGATVELLAAADTLQAFVEPIHALVDEAKLQISEQGIRTRAVDPANVAMSDVTLDAGAFESFGVTGDEEYLLGVNLERLADVLGFADGGELVELAYRADRGTLGIQVGDLDYTLALIDPDNIRQEPDLPDLESQLDAEVGLGGDDLGRAVSAADMVGEHIRFGVEPDAETFWAEAAGDTDTARIVLAEEDLLSLTPAPADSLFSLEYLKDMTGAIDDDAGCWLRLGEEFPLGIRWQIAEGAGSAQYQLAPRISSD